MAGRHRERILGSFAWGPAYTRSRQTWVAGAPYGPRTIFQNGGSALKGLEVCDDSVNRMPYPDTNFNLDRIRLSSIGRLTGRVTDSTSYQTEVVFTGQPVGPISYTDSRFGHLLSGGASGWKNAALARANPNRPDTDIINFLWELKDFTSLLHAFPTKYFKEHNDKPFRKPEQGPILPGRNKKLDNKEVQGPVRPQKEAVAIPLDPVKDAGGIGIEVQFAWKPLISDLQKLLGIAEAIDKRLATLRSLTNKIVKSRYNLDTSSKQSSESFSALNQAFWGTFIRTTERKVWCVKKHTIRLTKLKPPAWNRTDAFNNAFYDDMTITVWNSLPWSWLVDYFVDVGGFLAATGNRIPGYSVESLAIMCKRTTRFSTEARGLISKDWNQATWSGSLTHTPLKAERSTLERYCEAYPSPDFPDIQILSDAQFGNLSFLTLALLTGNSNLKAR